MNSTGGAEGGGEDEGVRRLADLLT